MKDAGRVKGPTPKEHPIPRPCLGDLLEQRVIAAKICWGYRPRVALCIIN